MKNFILLILVIISTLLIKVAAAQSAKDIPARPNLIRSFPLKGISRPLGEIPPMSKEEYKEVEAKAKKRGKNTPWPAPSYPFAATALPKGPDQAWQQSFGNGGAPMAPIQNFEGQSSPYYPPDCNGAAGTDYYMQTVNTTYSIYTKTGTLVAGPTNMNLLFGNVPGATYNDGDPIILYDEQAARWVAVEFSVSGTNDYMLFAVSTTSNPTGTWYQYSFDVVDMPDYEKVAVWRDGYYMGTNTQPTTGNDIYVFERDKMLTGATAQMVAFDNPYRPGTGVVTVPPVDNDGTFAPSGSPGTFIAFNDDAVGGGSDQLWIYELHVDWTTPASSTFARTQQLNVTAFDSQFTSTWDDISQPVAGYKLCAISTVIMNVPQYRNFGTYQSIVCCHTVDVDATNHSGIRWYELRKTPPATTWEIRQQGTYAPDAHSRWMGAISMNGSNRIALGFSISSTTLYPGIRYIGQSAAAYNAASGTLDMAEETVLTGTYHEYTYNRWGDYASMCIDPTNDQTFWFTTEYIGASEARKTKIISFNLANNPVVATLDPTAVTSTTATLNGTVNPNGLATTYNFQWGTTTGYGNTTTTTSAGSGSANVGVSAGLTGLVANTTYHYRIVAVNSDGTTTGNDMTLIPGAAALTTTTVSGISGSTASSGGNVTLDGGSSVTARGVCWGTSSGPTVSGSHTTDGSGTGTFTSSITGLAANTVFYVRAYAVNGNGTYYGNQVQFTSACGIFPLPLSENFATSSLPSCWTKQQTGTATDKWTVSNTALAGGTAYEMMSTWQNVSPAVVRLVTPPINTLGLSQLNLSFRHMLDAYATGCTLRVQSSTDGVNWTNEAWAVATTAANIAATTVSTTVLSNLNSASTYIAFAIDGNLYNYDYWYVDNVSVTNNCGTTYPVSVTIGRSANDVCQGTTVTFTATPTNGGSSPAYQWKVNGAGVGTSSTTYAYAPANGDVVTCVLTSNLSCATGNPATSNALTMTVNPSLAVSVSVSPTANPVCSGTLVTFTATPTNGGTTPSYQWKVNSGSVGTNSPTYAYNPANHDIVACVLTSNVACPTGNPATSPSVYMSVNPVLPVSISVSPSANPVCSGTSVTFTATPTNGGSTPSYQWKVNNSNVGTSSPAYAYAPANGDAVICVLTSNATCASGSPASSAPVNMAVNTVLPVSVSVSPSANPVCSGTSVTFTATAVNGGTIPNYQWKVNGSSAGTSSPTYSYTPANGDAVTCVLTSDITCTSGNPATSAAVNMTVNTVLPVSISVSPSANPVCSGTLVTFTATPVNGGTTPSFAWKVNGASVGTSSNTYSYIPANGDAVTCVMTSNASCVSGSPATSAPVNMTVNPSQTASVSVSASANPICFGAYVTFSATPTNGGTSPVYQWKVNGTNAGTNSTYSYYPVNNDVVTCVLTSNATCTAGNPATSSPLTMTVNPNIPVSVSVAASANPVCAGTSVTFTPSPINGGTPSYQWYKNSAPAGTGSTYSYAPANGDQVYVVMTSSLICKSGSPATSNTVTIGVNPASPASISIAPSANPVCTGTPVTFTATPTNGGTTPVYLWKVNGTNAGTNSPGYSYTPANSDVVTCVMTSNASCATGNPATSSPVTMTVNPLLPVSVSIGASANNICVGTSVTFTATPTNGGTTPVYLWKVNGTAAGTNSPTYYYAPANGDVVTCVLTSNASCATGSPATSSPVTMTVNPLLPVSVSIGASANNICAGTSVTFTATPTNGGTTPIYLWKVNGIAAGTNSPTYSYAPANSDVVTCMMTSNANCATGSPATSGPVTMTVNPLLPVSVSIGASANNICAGTSVTFTATPTNGGTTPVYLWKVNGIAAGTNSPTYSYAPANGDVVICVMTSNASCATGSPATSSPVTMTVNPLLPVSVSIGASANNICAGTSVTFTATPTNGGTTPAYLWKVNGTAAGTNSPTYTYAPGNGDIVTCVMTSNASCATGSPATSGPATMTVNPLLPVSVSIGASANPVCEGTSVTFTATPQNGGASPDYQWKVNGNNVGNNSATLTYAPADNDIVTCELTSDATCPSGNPATSNQVHMIISNLLTADFTADNLTPQRNETVQFTDLTSGTATSWNWTFDRTSVVFVNSTSQYSQNPQVQFTDGGLYTVNLQVSNISCSGSSVKTGYIRAGIAGMWKGNVSADWSNDLNWDNYLVPDSNTVVVIPDAASFWPVLNGDFIVGTNYKSLILSSPNSKITINGNLIIQ